MNSIKNKIKKSALYTFLSRVKNFKNIELEKNFDYFFNNIIEGNVVVGLENIPGSYEIDSRSDILKRILIYKKYEPEIVDLILKNISKNSDALNIGANIGLFANLLANNISDDNFVLAVEPTKNAHQLLQNNILRNNNSKKIKTYKGIITDIKGEYFINTIVGKEEYSSVGKLVHQAVEKDTSKKEAVEGISMDDLVSEYKVKPKLIVIDVEGAEFNVLQGGVETLKKYNPTIISELDDKLLKTQNTTSTKVVQFLEDLGYKVSDVEGSKIVFPFSGNIIAK